MEKNKVTCPACGCNNAIRETITVGNNTIFRYNCQQCGQFTIDDTQQKNIIELQGKIIELQEKMDEIIDVLNNMIKNTNNFKANKLLLNIRKTNN